MATATAPKPKPRERLLAAARQLFYEKGYALVGINEVIEVAGVAKASFYNHFPSKDDLIYACLDADHQEVMAMKRQFVSMIEDPRERILSVFDACSEMQAQCSFQGCHFTNALAAIGSSAQGVRELADLHINGLVNLFTEFIQAWMVRGKHYEVDIPCLARTLTSLLQGATLSAQVKRVTQPYEEARLCADALLDCAENMGMKKK